MTLQQKADTAVFKQAVELGSKQRAGKQNQGKYHSRTRVETKTPVNTTHKMNLKQNMDSVLFPLRTTPSTERRNLFIYLFENGQCTLINVPIYTGPVNVPDLDSFFGRLMLK